MRGLNSCQLTLLTSMCLHVLTPYINMFSANGKHVVVKFSLCVLNVQINIYPFLRIDYLVMLIELM